MDAKTHIIISNARTHNLKNISLEIPKNKLVVITGVSGSGKSSLAFDTLYAEGQRRYVESLSAYARQFMGRMNKPEVDYIKGIAPAIAIEQKVNTTNSRSTVGTSTEIYDYLKLFFARVGKTISPISNQEVKNNTVTEITDFILSLPDETVVNILYPIKNIDNRKALDELSLLIQKGFKRIFYNNKIVKIEDLIEFNIIDQDHFNNSSVVLDRIVVSNDDDLKSQLSDSIQSAFFEGRGDVIVQYQETDSQEYKYANFCDRFEKDGLTFEKPTPDLFSFNNPMGACKHCEGQGSVLDLDPDIIIPDKARSIYDGAVSCWRGEKMQEFQKEFILLASKIYDFPIHRPYFDLTQAEKDLLWKGDSKKKIQGINHFFDYIRTQTHKIQYRVMLSRYIGRTTCPECKGTRLRKDASYVKIAEKSIVDIVLMPVSNSIKWINDLILTDNEAKIANRLLLEITNRLQFLNNVGLGYLTLNRLSNTLSGGESQRINLATSLGSSLVGSIYVLDEPSIGLHPRDTQQLIQILKALRNAGNTVIVVEHEEEIIKQADYIIDIGPGAGIYGGSLMACGTLSEVMNNENSLTANYLSGKKSIAIPNEVRKWTNRINLKGVTENNLKNVSVSFPLNTLTCVTGVSGSGKTSLVKKVLYPALLKKLGGSTNEATGSFSELDGDLTAINAVEIIDQNPIGRSSRSNPVTYIKAYDEIRNLFALQQTSKRMSLTAGSFSFNVEGGRCDVCKGDGVVKIEMQFMADLYLTCESCNGKRFRQHILDVKYKDKNISEVLDLTVDEAVVFFADEHKIVSKLKYLQDVGLGYIHLGQQSNTLSGGEAQRIKLASFLIKGEHQQNTFFIFDEPTTGLHFDDINKLLKSFNALVDAGNTVIVIEHNVDVIKTADWVIDLGAEGGEKGGNLIYEGVPKNLIDCKDSYTGQYLKYN